MSTFLLPIDAHDRNILADALATLEVNEYVHGREAVARLEALLEAAEPLCSAEATHFVRWMRGYEDGNGKLRG